MMGKFEDKSQKQEVCFEEPCSILTGRTSEQQALSDKGYYYPVSRE